MNHDPMAFSFLPIFLTFFFSSQLVLASLISTVNFNSSAALSWTNANSSTVQTYTFNHDVLARVILYNRANPKIYGDFLSFAFGFYCNMHIYHTCLLAVMIFQLDVRGKVLSDHSPQVVWMANRDHLVNENAKLHVMAGSGLVLNDSNGLKIWSTNASSSSLTDIITLRSNGNLVLHNQSHSAIWSSFDHPVDTLLIGQVLRRKQRLMSSQSHLNPNTGKFSLSIKGSSLTAFVQYKRPVAYLQALPSAANISAELRYVRFTSRSVNFFYRKVGGEEVAIPMPLSQISSVQLLRLDADGGLRVYTWDAKFGWAGWKYSLDGSQECQQPLVCGKYGVCVQKECSCPIASDGLVYFSLLNPLSPTRGCGYVDASELNSTMQLVNFGELSYFSYFDPKAAIAGLTNLEACKQVCDGNSSCKAAFFRYDKTTSEGSCYLPSEILSIMGEPNNTDRRRSIAFIKVPISSNHSQISSSSLMWKVSAIVVSVSICTAVIASLLWWRYKERKRCRNFDFEQVFGVLMKFPYKELYSATERFSVRLGRGGFGTVFKGELKDGTVVAVKRLDSVEQGMTEFVAEMKTIGSIHHINLVKLIGFCADEFNRLLVYEYMSNTSLDKWIFDEDRKAALSWETRRKIILDIAKGLAYLHEECSKQIVHLDVKPHNILLDENFNAKISDFGLARFIDRKQSQVFTGMKGTFGYLAPEWQHSLITVKADIYSFGIVILEAVSGRMNLDYSLDKSDVHLLGVLERKAKGEQIIDIIDKKMADWELHEEDIMKMIRIGVWCLNDDQSKRPSMSTLVKVLEGTMEFEHSVDFKFAHVLAFCSTSTESSLRSSYRSYSC